MMVYKTNKLKSVFLLSGFLTLLFFTASFLTLKDYGISWDEILHFRRGQAYLHYFLTGKTNYQDLSNPNLQGTGGDPRRVSKPRRSIFQNDFHNADYFLVNDSGHPPISDIMAALFNNLFYQKLGILNDIDAYHLFNITASAVLVFIVVLFAKETLGTFPSVISFLALCTYPLFWAESHFNVKDPPEAAFFSGFIWAFYKSLKSFSVRWLALSIFFFSLGLGTKFNILFAIPILVIYLLCRYQKNIFKVIVSLPKNYTFLVIFAPIISLGILTFFWPFLWHNWFDNFTKIVDFYRSVGTVTNYQPPSFYFAGFNSFPILWILLTTPPIILILLSLGLISAFIRKKEKGFVFILWLLWFAIPILRVTVPGSSIYGGVRQIFEFIPAMALLCGLGAYQISKWFRNKKIVRLIMILIFIWPIVVLFRLHPNENVYFNFLIGGLPGAYQKNFPSWGNTFGNVYLKGIEWINKNVESGAKVTLLQGTEGNIPKTLVRQDINYGRVNWSGINRGGEYIMEMIFNDTGKSYFYAWEYVDKFLIPVYEYKVDGVTLLKIWKNDLEHTVPEFQKNEFVYKGRETVSVIGNSFLIDFGEDLNLSRIELDFRDTPSCLVPSVVWVETSLDGKNWTREKDGLPFLQVGVEENLSKEKLEYFFAERKAKYVRLLSDSSRSCLFDYRRLLVKILK